MSKVETNLKKSDFEDGKLVKIEISGKSIVLGQVNGKIYAMDSVCSHQDGPLEDGWLDDYNITCPWHQGIFDIRNGKASTDTNWVTDMKAYTVIVDDKSDIIYIEI
ncbi:MAG: Rieske (2Fe-2S) protein [Nitrososphaeraceae archaeon]